MSQTELSASQNIISTTCAYCGVGCGIDVQVDSDTRQVTLAGQSNHPANFGRLCSKGSALGETISLNERLLQPHINGEQTDWDSALQTVADGFKKIIDEHGPDSVAFYLSGQLLTEDYYVANKLMKGFIGSANIDTNSRLCMSSSVVGHKRAFGTDTVPGCYEDFENAKLITLVGSNTAWCHPVLFQRIKRYKEANPDVRVVVIDPRKTQTCDIADLHLPINLGTDVWLFNGLLNTLNTHNKINQDYVSQHCQGLDDALTAAALSSGNLSRLSKTLGVDEDDLAKFYQWFCDTEQAVTLYSQGVNQSTSGTDKVNSIINCHLATGRIGKVGMGPFSMTGQPNAMGGREVGGLANMLAAHMDFLPDNLQRVQTFWQSPTLAQQPGLTAVDMFDAIAQGKIKAVWIMATNPVVSLPNADHVKAALQTCELVVVSDCIQHTDTTALANVLLPATPWSEKDGTVTNSERRISRQKALLIPAGNAKHDWWQLCEVAKKMGFSEGFNFESPVEIFREHAALSGYENNPQQRLRDFDISALANISHSDYQNFSPTQWPINREHPHGRARFFADGQFYTPNRKGNLLALTPKLPQHLPTNDYPLKLNTGRIRDQWHTMTRTALAPKLNQHISEPFVEMHANDAQARQLSDGQIVRVHSKWGDMLGRLVVNTLPKKGDLFVPMHWTAQLASRGRINAVVNPVVDPYSKQPESKHTPVQVSPFAAKVYGYVLSKQPLQQWPTMDYQVQVKGEQHTRMEFAHSQSITDPMRTLLSGLGYASEQAVSNAGLELLSYQDAQLGIYRLALMKTDALVALAFIAPTPQLPQRTWLAMQFAKDNLDNRARNALLSGYAPAGEDIGRIVCACFSVGEKTIAAHAKAGCQTPQAVGLACKAGTNCGSCVAEIKEIITQNQ